MSSGPIVALEIMAASAIRKWRDLLGMWLSLTVSCCCINDSKLQPALQAGSERWLNGLAVTMCITYSTIVNVAVAASCQLHS